MDRSGAPIDVKVFLSLVPLGSLSPESFRQVARHITVKELNAGRVIFRRGDTDNQSVYLLSGKLELTSLDNKELVGAESTHAKYALSNLKPRQFTAQAVTKVTLAYVDSRLLDEYLAWDQVAKSPLKGFEVTEFEGAVDAEWMFQMLQTKAFMRLPTGNIQALFSRFEEIPVRAGQVIIKQGDPGDYYYIIKQGKCRVSRQSASDAGEVTLAEFSSGDAFGEESLISEKPRNATVSMLGGGVLMRLAKSDFNDLLEEPLLKWVTDKQAAAMAKDGAVLLDVRLESEFNNRSIRGSQNLPLYLLRLKAGQLDSRRKYVVFCDTGARSAAAAFLLSERGIDTYVLKGGLASLVRMPGRKKT